MTISETSLAMRRIADALDASIGEDGDAEIGTPKPALHGEKALGAAALLCFLRDCFTGTDQEQWSRDKILVLLETVSRDQELFPCGIGQLMWSMDDEDQEK